MITPNIIEEVKHRLVQTYSPVAIYLFGSYAWGKPHDDSDLDILVVVDASTEQRPQRSIPGLKALWGMEISKDLMVFTQEEFEKYAIDETTLCHKVKRYGKVLYARS